MTLILPGGYAIGVRDSERLNAKGQTRTTSKWQVWMGVLAALVGALPVLFGILPIILLPTSEPLLQWVMGDFGWPLPLNRRHSSQWL
jgi:hypothetical protein